MLENINGISSDHFSHLSQAYQSVGGKTWANNDFLEANLESSRNLFTEESMIKRCPLPKKLEVFALVAGLPFPQEFINSITNVQKQISEIIGDCLHYWVKPNNLGVEYCVFKWPTDPWKQEWLEIAQNELEIIQQPAFKFSIGGIQINPDGCVVARGYDENSTLFNIRDHIKANIDFLPSKQSGWAHVPLGRILEPVGTDKFAKLAEFISSISDTLITCTTISSMKLIHEKRWYMEEKTVLKEYMLNDS
ncbi:MAG: hypothetical protein D6B28_04070 [Gammaproteobacteria bacterium]|nr:MAG: hypothetical protein D6B28_04070 [Gammaproteobacteria bacterium]